MEGAKVDLMIRLCVCVSFFFLVSFIGQLLSSLSFKKSFLLLWQVDKDWNYFSSSPASSAIAAFSEWRNVVDVHCRHGHQNLPWIWKKEERYRRINTKSNHRATKQDFFFAARVKVQEWPK